MTVLSFASLSSITNPNDSATLLGVRHVGLEDLRFADITTFLAVQRAASITGAARTLRVTPSQVSKAVGRLEDQLGMRLLARGARGVTLTPAAMRVAPQFEEISKRVGSLRAPEQLAEITVAAPSFLNTAFLPTIATSLPAYRVRGIELPPALVRAYAAENTYDLALTIGAEPFPETWEQSRVGEIRKALFAPPGLARKLGKKPISSARLAEIPFVVPIYSHNGRFMIANEGCPIHGERVIGHEVQTVALALELAARTEQLVFAPTIAAAPMVERGELIEIVVRGWNVNEDLYIAANGERMRARARTLVIEAVRDRLLELGAAGGD